MEELSLPNLYELSVNPVSNSLTVEKFSCNVGYSNNVKQSFDNLYRKFRV